MIGIRVYITELQGKFSTHIIKSKSDLKNHQNSMLKILNIIILSYQNHQKH